jgi:hypothetical protein
MQILKLSDKKSHGTKFCGAKCVIHLDMLETVYTVIADCDCDLWSGGGIVSILTRLWAG